MNEFHKLSPKSSCCKKRCERYRKICVIGIVSQIHAWICLLFVPVVFNAQIGGKVRFHLISVIFVASKASNQRAFDWKVLKRKENRRRFHTTNDKAKSKKNQFKSIQIDLITSIPVVSFDHFKAPTKMQTTLHEMRTWNKSFLSPEKKIVVGFRGEKFEKTSSTQHIYWLEGGVNRLNYAKEAKV